MRRLQGFVSLVLRYLNNPYKSSKALQGKGRLRRDTKVFVTCGMGNKYHDSFESGYFYHIYNRSNNQDIVFASDRNYQYFLERWGKYLSEYVEIYAYCLLPTHFHFLVRIKENAAPELNNILEKKLKNMLSGYSMAYNKEQNRHGSLFQKGFKRIKIDDNQYLIWLIHYIHHNPIHHHLINDFSDWKYSSYNAMLSDKPSKIARQEVQSLFDSLAYFIQFHQQNKDYHAIEKYL